MATIELEIKNNIAHVTLNRPEVRNAFNSEMIEEMVKVFSSLQQDSNLRAVFLKGARKSFCAGGDLGWMKSMVSFSEAENLKDSKDLFAMFEALKNIPVPVVSLVHGHAMGGGMGLIAASDIVFVVEGTQMSFSEVKLGLAPAVISAFVKEKILPRDMYRYFLTAEVFGPSQAYDMGLVHGFGKTSEMEEAVKEQLSAISKNGPVAVRETKALLRKLNGAGDVKAMTTKLIAQLRVGDEGQEGLNAFFEKRKPSWIGSGHE